ncbi:MAG: acetyl-CoA carboxylase carboxyltransferase subunit beta [Calditrichaeota bacterium]|nr:acetyl-CoA carboxylase carboxyltransferase subunit beta [Candidatus Cloacimonadota bacterium]MCA9786372.1 acetyl-CoA carboxylase carboxyltransferase subunit beta [Candidatus Cloacimonadota bacterium]MCB1047862.1 acetyl-CoA carboxylase carboxyltransferase subunit beta [Calditrichota bacterium]MCB9474659.1 acetyl-CoA carboxylase carboxyltransferase subunit beta [Candidatus Delongbacteria bacterium]
MSWFKRDQPNITAPASKQSMPDGLWLKCKQCNTILYRKEVELNLHVCHECGHHMRINSSTYRDILFDEDSFVELGLNLKSKDFLAFVDSEPYSKRIDAATQKTGMNDAVLCGTGTMNELPVAAALMDFFHFGGSVGSVVGEKIAIAARVALEQNLPLLVLSASGGMRMQESTVALMQMAKVSALLTKLADRGLPFISLLTDPTTGGTSASFAMLGDVILAEPGALICFAGPRVIKQTIGEDLPPGFQRSEFLLEHGFVDRIVPRVELKDTIENLFRILLAGKVPGRPA